ncbi:DUF2635 domain-containing protein [Rhodospirillum sp. A1_3_36]|uniref:DUF2635 domain-containing protein n=1 Tax=Rhodospirillum sp. A1_3_36 TaxID=3391666 RepID=UPI0039A68B0F
MAKTLFLKPADPEIPVPDPDGRTLPVAGKLLPDTPYWRRRLTETVVVRATPPAPQKAKAVKTPTEEAK